MNNEFQLDKERVKRSFNQAADSYDKAARLQRYVADQMIERLNFVKIEPKVILDIGSGTGYCTKLLQKKYKKARVVSLDLAINMLKKQKREKSLFAKESFVCGDAEALPLQDASVDLVVSSLCFQWCNDYDRLTSELARVLKPGGLLMFSTKGPDTLKELRQAFQQVDNKQHVHLFYDMHDIGDALVRHHFKTPVMDVERLEYAYRQVISLLKDLKAIGAHNAMESRSKGLMGKKQFQAMVSQYEKHRDEEGFIKASYEIVYGHAWAPEKAKPQQGDPSEARVPIEDIIRRRRQTLR